MKLTNYALQTQIEYLSRSKSTQFFADYLRSVLQDTSKPYYQRADYIGLSLLELKLKIELLSNDIKELEAFKKRLTESLEIAKEITSSIFLENGIDRIDGNIISSITLTKQSEKTKTTITVLKPSEVMKLGYVTFEPDIKAIEDAIKTDDGLNELKDFISIDTVTNIVPSKVKVNAKHLSSNSTQADALINIMKNEQEYQCAS